MLTDLGDNRHRKQQRISQNNHAVAFAHGYADCCALALPASVRGTDDRAAKAHVLGRNLVEKVEAQPGATIAGIYVVAGVDHERIVGQVVGMHGLEHFAYHAVHAMNERPVGGTGANYLVLCDLSNSL